MIDKDPKKPHPTEKPRKAPGAPSHADPGKHAPPPSPSRDPMRSFTDDAKERAESEGMVPPPAPPAEKR